jgi:hypothetical protein
MIVKNKNINFNSCYNKSLDFLVKNKLDAFFITSLDKFRIFSENNNHNFVYKISGFSGSNGIIFIRLQQPSYLLTDGRYISEAKNMNNKNFTILELNNENLKYIFNKINGNVGFLSYNITQKQYKDFSQYSALKPIIFEEFATAVDH